jgi:hypothetical protein
LGGGIIFLVATDAIIAEPGESQVAFICMAFHTTQVAMGAYKGKPVFFMQFRNICHQPCLRGMAANTIVSNRLTMHVRMAGGTVCRGFVEYQGTMTKLAVCLGMGAFEWKLCFIVVKLQGTVVNGPSCRVVALNTVHFQLVPVRGLPYCRQAV